MSAFSPELIARITKYFSEKYEVFLTPEEAWEYLHTWAGLWVLGCRAPQEPQPAPVIFIKLGT